MGRATPQDVKTIVRDADVAAAFQATWARALPVNGVATPTFGTEPLKSTIDLVVLSGRAPAAPDEIAFAPTTMKSLHLHTGDTVTVGRGAGVRVVGEALLPATSHTDYDQSGWMTVVRARGRDAAGCAAESRRHRGLRGDQVATRCRRGRRRTADE